MRSCSRPTWPTSSIPDEGCLRLLNVRHSAFYASSLDYLLGRHEARRLILTGQVTEQCILYSALDAYLRGYEIIVPCDAVAHIDEDLAHAALEMMRRNLHAEIMPAADVFSAQISR